MSIVSCFPTKGDLAKLTGQQGQFVGFTADNVVGAMDAPKGLMIVNITGTESSCTTDKTSDEIKAAVADGYWVFANVFGKYLIPLTSLESYGMFSAVIGTNFSVRVAYRGQNTVEYVAMELPVNASGLNFNNSETSLTSWNVQDAIEEVNAKSLPTGGTPGQMLYQGESGAEWGDKPVMYVTVTSSGDSVTADKTVAEIQEAVSNGTTVIACLNGELYFQLGAIYDGSVAFISTSQDKALTSLTWSDPSSVVPNSIEIPTKASNLSFAKAGTGLNSENVQDAIEEVNEKIPSAPKSVSITLPASGWSSDTQTVTVNGVLADESAQLIQPMPAVASQNAYISAGVICSGQAANQLSFTCSTTPTEDISLYVVLTEVQS